MRMSHPTLAALAALIATFAAPAQAAGDAKAGKAMHDKDCVACHARQFGGDGTKIYTRTDRRVNTLAQLRAQVAACNSQLPTRYFPEEEEHVAAYLNLQYYKFKP
ncbi:MAG: cytochrome c [Betaproteobacteria bacterium]